MNPVPGGGGLIRPLSRANGDPFLQLMPILIGFLFGSVVTFLIMVPLDGMQSRHDEAHLSVESVASHKHQWLVPAHKGWHPILVFFGNDADKGLQIQPDEQWFSQVHQDEIIHDLLGDEGYFIDLAANDAKEFSNTLALERRGWDGLCIEPNPAYWYGLSHRKCTVVGAAVGGDRMEEVQLKFRGVYGGIVGKMDNKLANRKKEPESPTVTRYTAPIRAILNQFRVPKVIDYLSLDVEGSELLILQHFPLDKYTIKVLTIERPSKELRQHLERHQYIFLKDLAWWGETLWAHESMGLTPNHPKIAKIVGEQKH